MTRSSPHTFPNDYDVAVVDEDSEKDSGVSFGERLRAGKDREDEGEDEDEQKRLNLTEQEGACLVVFGRWSCVGFGRLMR